MLLALRCSRFLPLFQSHVEHLEHNGSAAPTRETRTLICDENKEETHESNERSDDSTVRMIHGERFFLSSVAHSRLSVGDVIFVIQ